jgi:hypothetical protein
MKLHKLAVAFSLSRTVHVSEKYSNALFMLQMGCVMLCYTLMFVRAFQRAGNEHYVAENGNKELG